MTDLLRDLGEGVSALGSDWMKYSVVGSFLLYLTGYLAVRFHLTAIGIGTDLAVLDERYLFAGARFLVYLVASVPSMLLVFLPVALIVWGLSRVANASIQTLVNAAVAHPVRLAASGIVLALIVIQFVMRQCFALNDLLLARTPPSEPAWLVSLLLDGTLMPLYFGSLVCACALSVIILIALRDAVPRSGVAFGTALLTFLAAVQILLLPVNYGILIMDKTFPRLASVGDRPLAAGEDAWLVWDGKEGVTFLLRHPDRARVLLTIPRGEIRRTEIVAFDPILPTLFGPDKEGER